LTLGRRFSDEQAGDVERIVPHEFGLDAPAALAASSRL